MRFHLIDRIDELKKGEYAIGTKCVSLSDEVFDHHFPGQPLFPGSLLVEAMAQLGGALLELSLREQLDHCPRCVLSGVKAKFREPVHPGDALSFRAEIMATRDDSAQVRCVGTCGGKRVCDGEFLYMVVRLEDARLQAAREEFLDVTTRGTRIIP